MSWTRHPRVPAALMVGLTGLILLVSMPFRMALSKPEPSPRVIRVDPGMTLQSIADTLAARGLIASRSEFLLWARVTGQERYVQAGRYRFSRPLPVWELLRELRSGGLNSAYVTIPEGYTIAQIARLLSQTLGLDRESFLRLSHSPDLCRLVGVPRSSLEGYLFPDTYSFYFGEEPREVIRTMVDRFRDVFADSLGARAKALGFSVDQIVILASIIEREAKLDRERSLVSAVFHNRLRLGRALESCATVQYLLPEPKERLSLDDLQRDSPYNTYEHTGLPPGPICSPGRKSILAALYPASVDHLYFVARGDGGHIFSRTAVDHARAKSRIQAGSNQPPVIPR